MIKAKGLPSTSQDNDRTLIYNLEGILLGIDPSVLIDANKQPSSILFTVTPSSLELFSILLEEISAYFSIFGIKVTYSKSMKINKHIRFSINQT